MLIFLSMAFSIYGAMHFYALSKVWQAFPLSVALAWGLSLAGLILTLAPFLLWQLARQNWHTANLAASWAVYLWMGFLFLFCSVALLFDIGRYFSTFTGLSWPLQNTASLLSVTLLTLTLTGYSLYSARQLTIEKIEITTPKLASGKITIAQISDLHLGAMLGDAFLQKIIGRLREINPDIIVATGDVLDGQGDDLNALANRFRTLRPPMGMFAVTGNHEYFVGLEPALSFLRNAGFTVLRGEAVKTGGIILAGVDDPTAGAMGQEVKTDTRQALASVSKDDFIVLLKHQPVVDATAPFDLQLSGHVHGGQIFPFTLLTRLAYRVHTGLTGLENSRWLYVSRGTGTWGPPMRLFAAPEITQITIESAKN